MMIIAPDSSFQYNPFYYMDGQKCWNHMGGDVFHVTGVDRDGKRFKIVTEDWNHASNINLWRGSRWLVRAGKRWLINRVYN
jgi:hypothetical protein